MVVQTMPTCDHFGSACHHAQKDEWPAPYMREHLVLWLQKHEIVLQKAFLWWRAEEFIERQRTIGM